VRSAHSPYDLSLAFRFQAELGEECDGGVQIVDDDGDVVHPLNGHVRQHDSSLPLELAAYDPVHHQMLRTRFGEPLLW
jgi:hypothetical protein